jgi:transcriptional regulator with XRE-family HTH domain
MAIKFGECIAALRRERGLSQERLADAAGLHRNFVSLMERGEQQPTLSTIFALADALDVRPSNLVGKLEEKM